jgi:phosphoglycerol transferase MdoB-like AlkP superfamily enzyme
MKAILAPLPTERRDTWPWITATPYVVAGWAPAALLAMYLRWTVLNLNGGGFEYLAESLHTNAAAIPWQQKLALFRADLLVAWLVIPGGLMIVMSMVSHRRRTLLPLVSGLIVQILLFVQLKAFWEVGTFLPLSVLAGGVMDVGRLYMKEYTRWSSLLKLIALMGSSIAAYQVTTLWYQRTSFRGHGERVIIGLGWASVGFLTLASWAVKLPPNPYESSTLVEALLSTSAFTSYTVTPAGGPLNGASLMNEYRLLTNAPVPNQRGPYTGMAKGNDVLLVVLETAPFACLNVAEPEKLPPSMMLLAHRSFLASEHYSTYPFTERALFSIFSSWYPSNWPESFVKRLDKQYPELMIPGIARSTSEAGYFTAVFTPEAVDNWVHDQVTYPALGFSTWFTPVDSIPLGDSGGDALSRRDKAYAMDTLTLRLLEQQIVKSVGEGKHYFFSFQPQYTHGPWPGLTSESTESDAIAACQPLFAVVSGWIGDLVALLTKLGSLDRTIIVIVGDHGLRTREEHPSFVAGTLNQISFHVPLLIYAPSVLDSAVRIPWLTSHIDVAPSILDLLGLEAGRGSEQGSAVWNPKIRARRTYFFARNYLGADGYYSDNGACMYKYAIQSAFCAPWHGQLGFALADISPSGGSQADSVQSVIERMTNLQDTWAQIMIPENYWRLLATPSVGAAEMPFEAPRH